MKKIALLGASLLTAVTLAGCGGDAEEGLRDQNNNGYGVQPTRYNENTNIEPNRNRLQMDEDELGPDYYNGQGLGDDGGRNLTNNDNKGNYHNNDVNRETTNENNNNTNNNNTDEYDVADKAADQITSKVDEVDRAYVFTGPENAYVAVVLNNGEELSNDVENRIRRTVKDADNTIDDVFISANPDFFQRAEGYAGDLEAGDPVEGLFDEMGEMFRRIFPNN
ncbi:YhcN/YlaJ family sporulation lipoprotein [Salirhabdus sp. Marseille-P4669]|uniref:YhcN/YlaJ family sporulation lipoprotein n=1 Tax=Salirhabdus sp. Marseille-P4669 TaxID=2042310 RepID=UPI000C7D516D|nr:YhcN/YlaJ family sporulation lipoprotein [Salirhabdus sp. Marseille-P4669]